MANIDTDLRCYLTYSGIAAENNAIQLQRKLPIKEMVFGSGVLPDNQDPRNQTTMINEVLVVPCAMVTHDDNATLITFKGDIPVDRGGFNINEVAIRLEDNTIYGYARGTGDYKPTPEQGATESVRYVVDMYTTNVPVLECKIDLSSVYADYEDVEQAKLEASLALEAHEAADNPHDQYLSKTEYSQNEDQRNASLKNMPIFPEVLNDDNRLKMSLSGTQLTIDSNQIIRLHGWKDFNTKDIENKTFTIDLSKTYHLRFTESDGFTLHDVNDAQYNPDGVDEADYQFDTKYNDALIALISEGVLMRCIHTNILSKTLHLNGSGVVTIPTCPRLRTIRLIRADPELNYDGQIQDMHIAGVTTTKSSWVYTIASSGAMHWGHDTATDRLLLDSNNHGNDKTISTSILTLSRKMAIFMFYSSHAEIDYTGDGNKEFLDIQSTGYTPSAWKDGDISVNYSNLNIGQFTVEYVR
ncbi:phage tail protein [Vibrio brasiliensis]|uniref:phage tail-collar fiber domain-containing protein n=1 Tax=Vibrio brasiliensis TaxID=170652 RepID=UPI001EFEDB4C|nr:phage tail protein [Vibrio brasiliensis]MCG9785390.1 phage tail protein [Vibrio brasiliensis]